MPPVVREYLELTPEKTNQKDQFSEYPSAKMRSIRLEAQQKCGVGNLKYSSSQSPFSAFQTPNDGNISNEKEATTSSSSLSSILLVIIVLAVIFFVYGLVHLVLWFVMKRPSSASSLYNSTRFSEATRTRALQRQLQQLFRLHDSGLDQALIDALPVFHYQDLMGLKEPFDCAVCLCEFSDHDKLRLLPMCSHAFHMNCLDTWLLSNSTCPLCRATLTSSYFPVENPIFNIDNPLLLPNGFRVTGEEEKGCSSDSQRLEEQISEKRVFSVRLGKFRNSGLEGREVVEDSSCSLDARRCYSMGSYQYVVRDSDLQVLLSQSNDNKGGDEENEVRNGNVEGKRMIGNTTKGESFSASKIWLWSKRSKFHSSNAAFP